MASKAPGLFYDFATKIRGEAVSVDLIDLSSFDSSDSRICHFERNTTTTSRYGASALRAHRLFARYRRFRVTFPLARARLPSVRNASD